MAILAELNSQSFNIPYCDPISGYSVIVITQGEDVAFTIKFSQDDTDPVNLNNYLVKMSIWERWLIDTGLTCSVAVDITDPSILKVNIDKSVTASLVNSSYFCYVVLKDVASGFILIPDNLKFIFYIRPCIVPVVI